VLSFAISPFNSPTYNLPIFLFGLYVQESQDATHRSLQTFSGLLGASALFDIIWLIRNDQGTLTMLLSIFILILKAPTLLAFVGPSIPEASQESISEVQNLEAQQKVWSMPGGFTSGGRDGYQVVESETPRQALNHPPAGNPPSTPGTYQ
ncbi:hypothetical protein BGW80DRAFT_1153757, partial [Lactifluus volemus]